MIPPLGEEFAKTLTHLFPQFPQWIEDLADSRCPGKVIYGKATLVWSALSIFLGGHGSRRQFDREADADLPHGVLLKNLNALARTNAEDIPHGDTVAHYFEGLPPEQLEAISPKMVRRLLRMRALEHARLLDRYMIAFDLTGVWCFKERHCAHCLTQQHNGTTVYYHPVMEAKLVTPDGLALSVGSEFVENLAPNVTKQDCEQAAIGRLMPKVKERFRRLPVCALMDALHANQTVFSLCKKLGWDWIITFKKGSLPTAWDEFWRLKALEPGNVLETRVRGRYQRLTWINDLRHEGHAFSAFDCLTHDGQGTVQYFAWITNLRVNWSTVAELANQGGRTRWKIENQGFDIQKHHGYQLEHAYSEDETGGKNFYLLLQIAHILAQMLIHGRLGRIFTTTLGTLKNFFIRMADSLRRDAIPPPALDPQTVCSIQVRFHTS